MLISLKKWVLGCCLGNTLFYLCATTAKLGIGWNFTDNLVLAATVPAFVKYITPPPLPQGLALDTLCFELCLFGHNVSCSCEGEVLLLLRSGKHNANTWGLPGGNADTTDANLLGTAMREAEEEMGTLPECKILDTVLTR